MKQVFVQTDLQNVIDRIENEELEYLFYEKCDPINRTFSIHNVREHEFKLRDLKDTQFYIKTTYTTIEEQRVGES